MRRAFVGDFGPLAAFCPPIVRRRRRWDVGGGGLPALLKHLQTVCGGDKPIRRIRGAPHVISGLVRAAEPAVREDAVGLPVGRAPSASSCRAPGPWDPDTIRGDGQVRQHQQGDGSTVMHAQRHVRHAGAQREGEKATRGQGRSTLCVAQVRNRATSSIIPFFPGADLKAPL